jgi:hypothetical protein
MRALTSLTWIRRNPRRAAPIVGIQLLVTALMVAILTATNAFETTGRTYIKPLEGFTVVAPRWGADIDAPLQALLDGNAHMDHRMPTRTLWMRTPMLVGEGLAPLMAVPESAQARFLERAELRLVDGVLPDAGSDGALIHEAVLRAREMKLGDVFGQNVNDTDAILDRFRVVGVVAGEARVGLVDHDYVSRPGSVLSRLPSFELVYARDGEKAASDAYLHAATLPDGRRALRVFDAAFAADRQARALRRLPLLIGFITLSIAIVVALVTSLLFVLGFQTRADEFGLLLALGHGRGWLAGRLAKEAAFLSTLGWLLGVMLGLAVAWVYRTGWLEPNGILMRWPDERPILWSAAVPVLSALVSALVLVRHLRRLDPVQILQRRAG